MGCKLRYQAKGGKFAVSEFSITGSTVTQDKHYLLAITEYLAQGGDGITAFERGIRSPHKGIVEGAFYLQYKAERCTSHILFCFVVIRIGSSYEDSELCDRISQETTDEAIRTDRGG